MRTALRLPPKTSLRPRAGLAFAAVFVVSIAASQALASDQGASAAKRAPKVAEVHFFKQSGEQGPATNVEVFGRRIESLRFKAKYGGDTGKAKGREYKPIDDNHFGHPWIPDHDKGRRDLLSVMKTSLQATSAVTLKVVAKNDAGKTKESIRISFSSSDCHLEPPLYPFDCTVEL